MIAALWKQQVPLKTFSRREEQAMLTSLAGLVVVLLMLVNVIADLFDTVKSVFGL